MQTWEQLADGLRAVPGASLVQHDGGQALLQIDTALCSASVAVQGAQLLTFCPKPGLPMLWLSPHAVFQPGEAIRGGVPLCFPWFGPAPAGSGLPAHGFARLQDWRLDRAGLSAGGAVTLDFSLTDSAASLALWPHAFIARLRLTLGQTAQFEFVVENTGAEDFEFSYALHSYFAVDNVAGIQIDGLDACYCLDKNAGMARKQWHGAINGPVDMDAAFVDVPAVQTLKLADGRVVTVSAEGMASAVVWNPGPDKAAKAKDILGGWPAMVCIERGNVNANRLVLAPGQVHRASMLLAASA